MNYKKEIGTLESRNGIHNFTYYIYTPLCEPRAVFQISHGMCEYIERYEPFIEFLTGQGYIVCGNDHLGHKNSVSSKEQLGYFAPKGGYTFLPRDLARVTRLVQRKYSHLPFFLFGHSMGSFAARAYMVRYPDLIDGVILCGTSGPNYTLPFGALAVSLIKQLKGEYYRSPFVYKLMFGQYNRRYENVLSPYDWLTRDREVVAAYEADEYCNFRFTASGSLDLLRLLGYVSSKEWYHSVPKGMPTFVISGTMDPVGNFGKGIETFEKKLKEHGMTRLSVKLYPDMRHELLNELGKEEVYDDILAWLEEHI